jgi:hypothetical protein
MTLHVVFCSARDSNVTLATRSPDWARRLLIDPAPAGAVGCLSQGRSCVGTLCPFCAEPPSGPELEEARGLGVVMPA